MRENTDKSNTEETRETYSFIKKVLITVAVATAIAIIVLFIGYSIKVLLLIFAGILSGVILRSLADYVASFTHLPRGIALGLLIFLLLGSLSASVYWLGPQLLKQADTLYQEAPTQWNKVKKEIWVYSWGREIARENPEPKDVLKKDKDESTENHDMTDSVISLLTVTAGAVASIVFVVVIAIYIAVEPSVYTKGFIRLFPINRRNRIGEILDRITLAIQWWIVGQILSMLILGFITTAGLWLLGVPYYLILGIFTALMTFIPNIGPIIAGIPTILVALTVGIDTAIYVGIFYIIIQNIEGYFITPMIHRRAIQVAPVLIIAVQFLLYSLIGFIGVLVAMPLVACFVVIIQMLYIEDILGDSMDEELQYDYKRKNIF